MQPFTLNIGGNLRQFAGPAVMGILNVTPDSFYDASRASGADEIARRASQLVTDGADFIDVGAYSTRPGASDVGIDEELERLSMALPIVRKSAPDAIVSVDTFRAEVARIAVTELGADMINDVSGGNLDDAMFDIVAELNVPYILTHMRGNPSNMQEYTDYEDVTRDVLSEIGDRVMELSLQGVNDIIVDPGFGFSKTTDQNYRLLNQLNVFELFHRPILVGVSRKSMATKLLNISTADALNATTILNTIALQRGASILRVHDVKEACQAIELYTKTINS